MVNQVICALVATKDKAEQIILALVKAGVNPNEISILSSQKEVLEESESSAKSEQLTRNWRTETRVPGYQAEKKEEELHQPGESGLEDHTKAPEGATAGATTGGILGGTLGLLAGLGVLAIPGIGPLLAAGPLMAILGGIGAGGTIGGILGALVGVGIPETKARHYEYHLREGSIFLSIREQNEELTKQILDILKQQGAKDISVSTETLPRS